MKNGILILNPETITLLDNNIIVITYKQDDLFETLEAEFLFHQKIAQNLNKKVIFNFGNTDIEIDKDTTYDNVVDSFDKQMRIQKEQEIETKFLDKINNLSVENANETLDEIYGMKILSKLIFNIELPIHIQKKIADKTYRIYNENYKSEKIELLPPLIEIPKVKEKSNRQFF